MDGRRERDGADGGPRKRVCVVGASGKLGRYMVRHALDRDYEVVGVCREQSVGKLAEFGDRITVVPGPTDDRDVIARAVEGCDAVLTVLVPWGVRGYSSGTARAVLHLAPEGARLVFSCGWHVPRDENDVYSFWFRVVLRVTTVLARLARVIDVDDQVRACRRIYASDTRWTVVRGSDLEEGESQGLPVWRRHVGDPALASNITRRTDFALFMVEAITDDDLVHEAPAIVGRQTPSARAHAQASAQRGRE
ncbi:NAD(P)-dependent oxidoreductase [Nocardiopsis sp. YSL2]|uniref:NAD(P)-dependent oxidoreductase n=1 Tax=Nocardiopsis sp. YSL2 TaxID=2939492 RepID=UPI0026F412BC|nr:NAD(P)H-binding protein [Nocardiopsis sp. YSL2]